MSNILENFKDFVGSLKDDEPKSPLHVGEVMGLWTLLTLFQEGQVVYKISLNTTKDPELRHAVESAIKTSTHDTDTLKNFLIKEGIPLSSASAPKPVSEPDEIPFGVKYTDEELANLIAAKLAACTNLCGQALSQTLRNDVVLLHLQFLANICNYGVSYKALMRKRGWEISPPYYFPPGKSQS